MLVDQHVFPSQHALGAEGMALSPDMNGARGIPGPMVLDRLRASGSIRGSILEFA